MIWFVIACIAGLIGLAGLLFAHRFKADRSADDTSGFVRVIGVIALAISLIILGFDSTTVVPVRSVGVQTAFGKPVGVLSNGFHFVAPWSSIETFDGTVQTLKLSTSKDADGPPVTVRLKNATTAQVDVSVQWQIDTGGDFLTLYRQYKTFDNIQANVVQRQLANALNEVFEGFDPLANIDSNGNLSVQVTALASQVQSNLVAAMPAGLIIRNVTIPVINYSQQVENQINTIIAAAAQTRVAQQQEKMNEAIAAANRLLNSAGNLTPGVLYQNCLNLVQQALSHGWNLPPGFSCGIPGASVVIPTK